MERFVPWILTVPCRVTWVPNVDSGNFLMKDLRKESK